MKCPNCNKELELVDGSIPFSNVDNYHVPVVAATKCCGHAVRIAPVRTYSIKTYYGASTCDDWGNEFSPVEIDTTQD